MATVNLKVSFAEHLSADRIASLVSGIAAYGNVTEAGQFHAYNVTVFRSTKFPQLKAQLAKWELHGLLRWQLAT